VKTRLIRIHPTTVREVQPDDEDRKFVVVSRDGRYYQAIYFAPDFPGEQPDLAFIQAVGGGEIVQCVARALLAGARR
jgi:hypothetical protein